jgi:hypothetical protein
MLRRSNLGALPAPIQWAVDKVVAKANAVIADAERARRMISENNGRLIALDGQARKIQDPAKRAQALSAIKRSVQRQVELVRDYRTYTARFSDFAKKFNAFLAERGISQSVGMSGLAIAPFVVPVAIVGGLLVAGGIVSALILRANNASKMIDQHAKLIDQFVRGNMTAEQYLEATRQYEKLTDDADPKKDPLGLTGLAEALVPLAAIVAAILIVPPLLAGRERRSTGGM